MVNKPLIRPYFWGGYVRGGRLTSHELRQNVVKVMPREGGSMLQSHKAGGQCGSGIWMRRKNMQLH